MRYIAVFILLIVALTFAMPSITQSYASAKQAQAVIEVGRAAQLASAGNLLIITTLSILLLVALGVIVYLLWSARQQDTYSRRKSGQKANWEKFQQPDVAQLLPALVTALVVQIMNNQQQQYPAQPDQLFHPRYDVESFDDEQTWDDIPWNI